MWHPACEGQRLTCGQSLHRDHDKSRLVLLVSSSLVEYCGEMNIFGINCVENTRFYMMINNEGIFQSSMHAGDDNL